MRTLRPLISLAVAGVVTAAAVPAVAAPPPHSSAAPGAPGAAFANGAPGGGVVSDRHTITLITGDKIAVGKTAQGKPGAEVVSRARGTASIVIFSNSQGVFAMPDQVLPYVAGGKLDRRLFDVSLLAADGYDDEHTSSLPLIAGYGSGRGHAAVVAHAAPAHSKAVRQLPSISANVLSAPKSEASQFWKHLTSASPAGSSMAAKAAPAMSLAGGITKLWLDGKAKASLDVSVPSIGAPQAWKEGYQGSGVKIAVLDTGIDGNHPDFAGRIGAEKNFTSSPDTFDRFGHGTHVASIAAGSGAADNGKYVGVAPKATLLIGKVLGDDGSGSEDQIIAGMEWATAQGARVINMSLGADNDFDDPTNPMSAAVDQLSASTGALFVIAAGNDGSGSYTVTAPGTADAALAVGATDAAGPAVAGFSSQGPREWDKALKPEITGPGVGITAARAAGNNLGDPVDQYYQTLSGTSMATPHVAGAAAILAQRHPDWTGQQLKAALVDYAAVDPKQKVFAQGGGRVWVPGAVDATVTTDVASLSLGDFAWPQSAGQIATGKVTYRNDAAQPVTLTLSAAAIRFDNLNSPLDHRGDGAPGPVSVSPSTLTVPAHGTAAATVTAAIGASQTGVFAGYLTAQAGGASLPHVPLTYTREREQYRLDVNVYDANGNRPTTTGYGGNLLAMNLDNGDVIPGEINDGKAVWMTGLDQATPFPKGNYAVIAPAVPTIEPGGRDPSSYTVGVIPQITLDRDLAVTVDARQGRPVAPAVPRHNAGASSAEAWLYRATAAGSIMTDSWGADNSDQTAALHAIPSGTASQGTLTYVSTAALAAPVLTVATDVPHLKQVTTQLATDTTFNGRYRGPLIDVGHADPADLAGKDLHGKVVLLHTKPPVNLSNEPPGVSVADQVKILSQAGAALVLVIDAAPYDPDNWNLQDSPTPAAYVSAADGTRLAAAATAGGVRLQVVGTPVSDYAYYTNSGPQPRIPNRPTLDEHAFATVHATYHEAPDAWDPSIDGTTACRYPNLIEPGFTGAYGGNLEACTPMRYPFQRTEYVQAGPAYWQFTASSTNVRCTEDDNGCNEMVNRFEGVLKPGQKLTEQPFSGPLAPCAPKEPTLPGDPTYAASRTGNVITLWLGDLCSPDLASTVSSDLDSGDVPALSLYEDGVLKDHGGHGSDVRVSVGPHLYRLVDEVDRNDRGDARTSIHATTDWTFHSTTATTDTALPLPQVAVDLPTDLYDNALWPWNQHITLRPTHQPGAANPPFTTVTVAVSLDDGTTWQNVKVNHKDGTYQADIRPGRTSGFVSLRITATDAAGNSVTQTVIRAYGLAQHTTGDSQHQPN